MRNWVRPRWYEVDCGDLVAGTPYPDSGLTISAVVEPVICADCHRDCIDSGWYGDGPYQCFSCYEAQRPPIKQPAALQKAWRSIAWPVMQRYDEAYWSYCRRFGRRVVR